MAITQIPNPEYTEPKSGENALSAVTRLRVKEAAGVINGAFTWSDTAEGMAFWKGVYDRLLAISEGEVLK